MNNQVDTKQQMQNSKIAERIEKKAEKRVFVVLDTSDKSLLYAKKLISLLFPVKVILVFYIENGFVIEGENYDNINLVFGENDSCINLLPFENGMSKKVEKQINLLDKNTFFENTDKKVLFSSKMNIKNILKNRKIQTPVFQFLGVREPEETFLTFTQPSRVFSKQNDFYSDKIDSVDKMRKVFGKIDKKKKSQYLIEEYIEGQDVYAFAFKYEENVIVYSVLEKKEKEKKRYGGEDEEVEEKVELKVEYIKPEKTLEKEVRKEAQKFFEDFGFEKFVLIHYKKHQQRGLYFLNAFVDHRVLDSSRKKILESIFDNEGLSFEKFIKKVIF